MSHRDLLHASQHTAIPMSLSTMTPVCSLVDDLLRMSPFCHDSSQGLTCLHEAGNLSTKEMFSAIFEAFQPELPHGALSSLKALTNEKLLKDIPLKIF